MSHVNESKGGRYMDEMNGTQQRRISVDAGSMPVEEEELIEIGAPAETAGDAAGRASASYRDDEYEQGRSENFSRRNRDSYDDSRNRRRRAEDEDPDYSLDDVPPIPITQKLVILGVIVLLVIGGWYIFKYHFGIA